MRITAVEPVVLAMPLKDPVRTAFGTMTDRYVILVRVVTDAGVIGWGESWSNFPAWSPRERVYTITEGIAPLLIGQDPRNLSYLHHKLVRSTEKLALQWGAKGPIAQAISAVDIALWDIAGKVAGLPVCQMLGGMPGPVPVYASGLGPGDPVRLAAPLLEQGVSGAKLKVGFGPEVDRHNLEALRECLGPERTLLTDANQAWDLPTARVMIRMLEPFEPYWLEEPLPADQVGAMAELRKEAPFRLAAGENAYGLPAFMELLGAVDVLQPDVCKVGGITAAWEVGRLADGMGAGCALHYLGGAIGLIASLHLTAALTGAWRLEYDANPNPFRTELAGDLLAIRNGCIEVPVGPGLGAEPDPAMLMRYLVR